MNNSQPKKHNFLVAGKSLTLVRAFTIIELLVVISIIAILSLVVVTNAGNARAKSRDAKRVADIASIQLALAGFYNKCGQYPFGEDVDGTAEYVLTLTSECYDAAGNPQGFAFGDFMTKIPTDPLTGNRYAYITMTDTNGLVADYHLGAFMETQNQALRDRAGFDSTSNNAALNAKYYVYGGPYQISDGYFGMDATADPLLYDVRPGI